MHYVQQNILRLIQYQLKDAQIMQSKLVSVLSMHHLLSLKRVDRVSNGLHCMCIAFQFVQMGVLDPRNDSVKPE